MYINISRRISDPKMNKGSPSVKRYFAFLSQTQDCTIERGGRFGWIQIVQTVAKKVLIGKFRNQRGILVR